MWVCAHAFQACSASAPACFQYSLLLDGYYPACIWLLSAFDWKLERPGVTWEERSENFLNPVFTPTSQLQWYPSTFQNLIITLVFLSYKQRECLCVWGVCVCGGVVCCNKCCKMLVSKFFIFLWRLWWNLFFSKRNWITSQYFSDNVRQWFNFCGLYLFFTRFTTILFFSTKILPCLASKSILDKYYLQALILSLPLQDMHTNSHSHIPMKKHPMEDADCNTMIKKYILWSIKETKQILRLSKSKRKKK